MENLLTNNSLPKEDNSGPFTETGRQTLKELLNSALSEIQPSVEEIYKRVNDSPLYKEIDFKEGPNHCILGKIPIIS